MASIASTSGHKRGKLAFLMPMGELAIALLLNPRFQEIRATRGVK